MQTSFYENFTLNYPKLINLVNEISNVIFTILKTFLNTIFLVPILGGVLLVEIPRVQSGVKIFDSDESHSLLAACVLVLSLLTFQFLVLYIEAQEKKEKVKKYKFSLRLLFRNLKYFIGFEEPVEKSLANRYERVTSLLEFGVIFLSVVGSLQPSIAIAAASEKPWHEALIDIIFNSNADVFFDAAVGIVFAVVIVRTSTTIARYVGEKATDALVEMENKRVLVVDKINKQLRPKDFFEVFKSRSLSALAYQANDYFVNEGNNVRFFDSENGELSREFDITNQYGRTKFAEYVRNLRE